MPDPEDGVGPGAFYAVAPNNSNAPVFREGDRLICDPSQKIVPDIFVIAVVAGYDEPILARYTVTKAAKNGRPVEVTLVPENRAFPPVEAIKMADIRILGRVTHRTHRV